MRTIPELVEVTWRKSSYSDGGADNCLEVADGIPNAVPVRDSKVPDGPVLWFRATAWSAFIETVKEDQL
ncbi:DUF397 domain-containing protein [Streptomyces endophytica]|uniref:DUF397 domain-containing protein n=1 Tax=Streptomyces endophytica TaxID=2991496 RepID=A0ABY6PBC7_9ACTN|nr:DUF397 domain-containing protein [Streptomyces endophytica]UZJ30552.1 DUF397 domain-containing protein [Streptomyces endophytica]